jgi:hypothetical protein
VLTPHEILLAVVLPAIVSTLLAAIGAWRKSIWMMPLAAGAGFIVSYACFNVPRLPPLDGSDWLFWLAIPLTLLAVLNGRLNLRWGWVLAGAAGVVTTVVLYPLLPNSLSHQKLLEMALLTTGAGVGLAAITQLAQKQIGSIWIVMALCIASAGAGVVIFSSNFRDGGLRGIAAAAALGPVALLGMRLKSASSVAVFSVPLLAGLLVIGRAYPEPGVSSVNFYILLLSPALIAIGAILPLKRSGMRGAIALLAVIIAVAAVTAPTARAAKKAAEDPYADSYK